METIDREALGQTANFGELYNARKDQFCGISIFKKTLPQEEINSTDSPHSETSWILSDKLNDKFKKFNIEGEVKASVLAGLVSVDGSAKYLSEEKESAKTVKGSFHYNIKTKVEKINILSENVKQIINLEILQSTEATHVVVGITWGANSTVTFEYANRENHEIKKIEGALELQFSKIKKMVDISGGGSCEYDAEKNQIELNFNIRIYADIVAPNENLPQTPEEVFKYLKKIPYLLSTANDGKGKPLAYKLVSLSVLRDYFSLSQKANQIVKHLEEHAIVEFFDLFSEITDMRQEFYDLQRDITNHFCCIPEKQSKEVTEHKNNFELEASKLKSDFAAAVVSFRSAQGTLVDFSEICSMYRKSEYSVTVTRDKLGSLFCRIREKIHFYDILIEHGVVYVGRDRSLNCEQMIRPNADMIILFLGENFPDCATDNENQNLFLSYVQSLKSDHARSASYVGTNLLVVDQACSKNTKVLDRETRETRICHYINGKCVNSDMLKLHKEDESLCLARRKLGENGQREVILFKPNMRVFLDLQCPGSLSGHCKWQDDQIWHCDHCRKPLEFGFDGYFYCLCGREKMENFEYKCDDQNHGFLFLQHSSENLLKLISQLRPLKEINVLFLGETGVGKSTWINSFANYMTHSSLEEAAAQKEPPCLISTQFSLTDEDYVDHVISVKGLSDKIENSDAQQSGTLLPSSYVFHDGNSVIRFIDTPGIGDTRGIEFDTKNFDQILHHLSYFDELHAICIVLKPDSQKVTVMFRFCVNELLRHLSNRAIDNIVFCFTNTQGTFYVPGETLPALKKLLKDNNTPIVLSKDLLYCFDNEAYRYLCAKSRNCKIGEDKINRFRESWNHSAKEAFRLLDHIKHLEPHRLYDTISLNKTQKNLHNLIKPLGDISKNIQDNIAEVARFKKVQESLIEDGKDLEGRLYIPEIRLTAVPTESAQVICSSKKCTENRPTQGDVGDIFHFCFEVPTISYSRFKQEKNVPTVYNIWPRCTECRCTHSDHNIIFYTNRTEIVRVQDDVVQNMLHTHAERDTTIKIHIKNLEDRIVKLKLEEKEITKTCAIFCEFLKSNSIIPYNDAFGDYLQYLINEETKKIDDGEDFSTIVGLNEMLLSYESEKNMIKLAKKGDESSSDFAYIDGLVEKLHQLKINGKSLKQLMVTESLSNSRKLAFLETTYRVPGKKRETGIS